MSRSQLKKLAIRNPSTPTEELIFSVVQEGAAEASRQVVSITPVGELTIEDSQKLITSKMYDLNVVGMYSASALAQLESWNGVELEMSGIGLDNQIFQMEGKLLFNQGFDGHASFKFSSPRETTGWYNTTTGKHTSNMSYDYNGLALYKWQESATAGIASDWTKTGGTTSWSTVTQTFSTAGASDLYLYRDIYFPFVGERLWFTVDVTGATVTTTATVGIVAYESNGTTLVGAESTTDIDATGDFQVDKTLATGTKSVRVRITVNNASVQFRYPTLQLSSTYSFTEFNT